MVKDARRKIQSTTYLFLTFILRTDNESLVSRMQEKKKWRRKSLTSFQVNIKSVTESPITTNCTRLSMASRVLSTKANIKKGQRT